MSDKIKVAIRVRPLIEREKLDGLPLRWITNDDRIYQIDPASGKSKGDAYTFDHIFGASESNKKVFDTIIKPIIDASMQGFNGTVFAYGQTSSGKTYTMSGNPNCVGIIQMAINYIFYSIENTPGREFLLRVSYMEIYNEKVNDLLDLSKKNLKLLEDCNGQVIVSDVEEHVCKNSTEVFEEKMKGDKNRRIGETNMNERSSRSHTIFRIILESRSTDDEDGAVKVSHLNLVDLAGSERSGQSGATGDRFKEGCHINMSLTTLGIVINQLSEIQEGQNQFINFRDSKLTRLLQSSLGGNALTAIVCAVTPAAEEQTQNTLSFASRAKRINNKPILNEVLSESALIKRYLKQIAKLNHELEVVKQKSGISEVEAISKELKEKEEINKVLSERISRLKEALIVSSSSPARKRQKVMPREKRRHSWGGLPGGGGGSRKSLSGRINTLTTIEEQSPSAHGISPPQANSTRLDDTICPFEKFELELMRDRNRDDSDMVEVTRDSILEEATITDGTIYNCDKSVDLTLVSQGRATPRIEGTPPFVLRQRINSMSTFVKDVVKEYDELREFTTLEKQFHTEEINNIIEGLKQENSSLKIELELSEESRRQTEAKLVAADDKITSLENELFTYKENILEMEDKLLKNSDTNLLKELAELKEVNARIEDELKKKAEDFQKLKEQADEVNTNYVKVTAEKDKLQSDMRDLIKKVKELETINSDLEVTLDHKSRKSIERETELENELKAAWQVLESREKMMRKDVIDKECLQLKKITIEETFDANCTSAQDEIDRTVNDSNSAESTENDRTVVADSNSAESIEIDRTVDDDSNSAESTKNDVTVSGSNAVESTERREAEPCDVTFNNTMNDLNATVEATERSNFVACDATFSNMSMLSPIETSDPLKSSFCLSESLIPVEIQAEEDDEISPINVSAVENKLLIQDLCDILGDKDELKQKIVEMKSEAANILKEYEDKKSDLIRMTEDISSYEAFINSVKQALNLEGDQQSFVEIEKEINNLKLSKDNMEASFKTEINKLQTELDRTRGFGQVIVELSKLVDTDSTSHSDSTTALLKKISDLVQLRTSFLPKITSILFPNETKQISEEALVDKIQSLLADTHRLVENYNKLSADYNDQCSSVMCTQEDSDRLQEKLENLLNALEIPYSENPIEFSLDEAEEMSNDASNAKKFCQQIIDMHDLIGEEYDLDDLSCEVVKNAFNNQVRSYNELREQMDTLENAHGECGAKIEHLKLELEEKSTLLNQLITSIQTSIDITCTKDNVVECTETINKELSEMKSILKEQSSKLTDDERMKNNLQQEIDVLLEKVEKFESFITNCHSVLKGKSNEIDHDIDRKSKTILDSIENAKELELQVEQLREEVSSLVKHKEVLENIFEILSDNSDVTLSIGNVLDEMTKYKNEMQDKVDKLGDCRKRISEMENQIHENEIKNTGFTDVFGKIRGELDMTEDMTIELLPGLIVEMKNRALTSSDRLQKLEEFVDNCYSVLNVYCDLSTDDKLASIVDKIHELVLDIESTNEENMSLKQYKETLQEIFKIFSENQLSIENVIPVLTRYKLEFGDMRMELKEMDNCVRRTSELENQLQETETKSKYFANFFEKILAEFVDEDVTVESLPGKIIHVKNQALTSSDVAQKLQEFVNSCVSALSVECDDLSQNVDDRLSSILVSIQQLSALKSESETVSEENSILIKHKEVLEQIIQTLSEDNDAVITVENVVDELTKYKMQFVEMHEQLEEIDENTSDIKSKNNTFVQVFEKISNDFEGALEIEMLPEVINKMKTELNELNKFKLDVGSLVKTLSANESDIIYTTEELISALKSESETVSVENSILIKHKEVLEQIIQTLSEDNDAVITVENVVDELTKYKMQFVEMHEQLEEIDENTSDIKSKNNTFVQVFEKIFNDFEGALEIEMLPEVINKMKTELNELNKFKLDVGSLVKILSANGSDVTYTTEELISAVKDTEEKIVSLNEKLESVQEENGRLAEVSNNFDLKLKEYMSIGGIISSLGTDFGSGLQVKIEEIIERQIECPELNRQIGKLVEFNRAYLELENKLCKTIDDMKVGENTLRNLQCVLGAEDVNNIENAVNNLKNEANELAVYKNLINEISGHLSTEQESSISSENLLTSIVDLKNQISVMTEKMETLETRNVKLSESFEDLDNKMKHVGDVEQVISSISSVLEVESKEEIVFAVEDLKKKFVDLKNDAAKTLLDKDSYLQTIQCLFKKFSGDVDASNLPCDDELIESVISKADSMSNEISRLKELFNGIKQLLSDLSEVDLQFDDEIKLEDVKNAIEDIKKNLCEVYELKAENMNMKTEVEAMKEKMQTHFECVDIVFNLCNLLSEAVGKTIAKCDILKIVDSLLQKGTIPLNESSVIDMEESTVKVSETDNLRKELNDLNTYFNSLAKIFDAKDVTNRDNLLQFVNNLKNDHANLVSKYDSIYSECVIYKDSLAEVIKSVFENVSDDTGLDERIKMLTERFHALKEVESEHSELLSRNQLLADFQNSITEELGLTNSTPESTVEALKVLKSDLEKNQTNVHELKIQLDAISSEKVDLKEKVDCIISVIRENISSEMCNEQESYDFYKCELLKMVNGFKSHEDFYNDLCTCLSDRVEDLSKESLCSAVAVIKEENNSLNRALQELSANNEKIISDLNSAYESVMSKLDLTKENEKTVQELKVLLSGDTEIVEGDLLQSVTKLIEEKAKMDARLQEMMSEISMMKSSMTEKQNVHCELDKCQSLLRAIKLELDMSDGDNHNELLDAISELKSKSDQASEELSSVSEQLRKCAEHLNVELLKINGKVAEEDDGNDKNLSTMQLLSSKSLLEQLKSDSNELVNLCNCNQALVNNLKSEIDTLSETVKNLDTANSEREALLQRIHLELELQTENGETVFDSIKMLKDDLQQLRNENACVKASNEEHSKTSKNLKQELQNNIESNEKLVEGLKNELADRQKVIEDLRNEMKRIEVSAKMSENQVEVKTKIEETLKELDKVQQKLDDFIAVDKTLKKKLIIEIKNLKSDFKPGSDEETSVQLLDSFVAVVMEKYQEVIMTLNQNFEADRKTLKEKINQLESKEKKTKEWIEQLEAEADSTNQDINAKSMEIDRLTEIVKKHESELTRKSEDLENIRQNMKTCEIELNSLRAENKEMADKLKDQLSEQNHSASDSLKLKENLEKTIEERDALSTELNNKKTDISRLQSTVDSQQQELKGYFNKLNEQQVQLAEKDSIVSNLKDKNEACLQEIEDLKQELKKEKDECDRLSSSLNTLKAEYDNVQQSLETNRQANVELESKLEEFFRDMNDTKAMAANLVESLKNEEQKAQAKQKALENINEEKTNECNDLKTKLYLLEMEISKCNSTQGETMSKLKEEVDAVNKINKELRDDILEKEKLICNKQNECQRLENEVADLRKKFDEYSRTLSLLQSNVIKKDQELAKLENLKEEAIKLQNCLKDEETKCADFKSRNSLLEKDLIDRANQITKLQLTVDKYGKELQEIQASSNVELDRIKLQLKDKEDMCNAISNTAALLEKQIAESEKIITKLKSDIICKDEDLSKMRKELSRLTVSLEEATKSELKHQPKKLKLNALNKFENFGSNEKENDMCLKLNTSHNTPQQQQFGGCLKCRKLEKEMGSLFKIPVEGDLVVEKVKQSLVKLEEIENKYNILQTEYKTLDAECDDLNTQITSLETEGSNLVVKSEELTQTCNKLKDDYEKELAISATLKKKNENLTKDLDACRIELERCHRGVRRERSAAALHGSFRESDRRQPMDLSASEAPSTPNAGDFKSIKHRWEQLSTSTQKHQPAPSKECQCEELTKQNQELKLELADKNNKVTLLEIQIQGQNFPYKKKAATLEEALNESKTKIMTLKQEVRRLQTCLHDVSVFQSCETCRNKAKTTTTETAVQTTVTDTEASVSGSEIIQRQSINILKDKTTKLERENMLLKRLCRDRNRKIELLEHELKAGSGQKT